MKRLFYLILLGTLLSCGPKKLEPEIYLVPKGFIGRLMIVSDRHKGTGRHEGKSKIYEFSANGISVTKFPFESGELSLENIKYYYVDTLGRRERILGYIGGDYSVSDNHYVMDQGYISYGFERIRFKSLIIDTPKNIDKYSVLSEMEINRLKSLYNP